MFRKFAFAAASALIISARLRSQTMHCSPISADATAS